MERITAELTLTSSETADLLDVHPSTVKRWCNDGELPFDTTHGGHRRIRLEDAVELARTRGIPTVLLPFHPYEPHVWDGAAGDPPATTPSSACTSSPWAGSSGAGSGAWGFSTTPWPARSSVPFHRFADEAVAGLMSRVGAAWAEGRLRVAEEHVVSQAMSEVLLRLTTAPGEGARPTLGAGRRGGDAGGQPAPPRCPRGARGSSSAGAGTCATSAPTCPSRTSPPCSGVGRPRWCASPFPRRRRRGDVARVVRVLGELYDASRPYALAIGGQFEAEVDPSLLHRGVHVRGHLRLLRGLRGSAGARIRTAGGGGMSAPGAGHAERAGSLCGLLAFTLVAVAGYWNFALHPERIPANAGWRPGSTRSRSRCSPGSTSSLAAATLAGRPGRTPARAVGAGGPGGVGPRVPVRARGHRLRGALRRVRLYGPPGLQARRPRAGAHPGELVPDGATLLGHRARAHSRSRGLRVAVGALWLVAWDLALDPAMSYLTPYWRWERDGPVLRHAVGQPPGVVRDRACDRRRCSRPRRAAWAWTGSRSAGWPAYYGVVLLMPLGHGRGGRASGSRWWRPWRGLALCAAATWVGRAARESRAASRRRGPAPSVREDSPAPVRREGRRDPARRGARRPWRGISRTSTARARRPRRRPPAAAARAPACRYPSSPASCSGPLVAWALVDPGAPRPAWTAASGRAPWPCRWCTRPPCSTTTSSTAPPCGGATPTVAAAAGVGPPLVLGDHYLTGAYRAAAAAGSPRFLECFIRAVERTVAGEIAQGRATGGAPDARSATWRSSPGSPGSSSAPRPRWGAPSSTRATTTSGSRSGRALGTLYQRVDDLLDFCPAAATGKPPLQDYRQRKWTWVLDLAGLDGLLPRGRRTCWTCSSSVGDGAASPARRAVEAVRVGAGRCSLGRHAALAPQRHADRRAS